MTFSLLPLLHVLVPGLVLLYFSYSGLLDAVFTEIGFDHYAEEPWTLINPPIMPLNSIVNIVYSVFGLAWLLSSYQACLDKIIQKSDLYYFHVFSWMSILYGFIQLLRILTQTHASAILDQWVTLPIFSWVVCWGVFILFNSGGYPNLLIITLSVVSYLLALKIAIGFEIALAAHICSAIILAFLIYRRYPSTGAKYAIFLAVLCCLGFVVLKLLDLHLVVYSDVFKVVSGHFLSKLCDIGQFHYTFEFFYCIHRSKYHVMKFD